MRCKNVIPRTWKTCTNKEIITIYNEVIEEAERLGYITHRPALYLFKSTCYWGMCRTRNNVSYIGLNEIFIQDPEKSRETCIHELAHALNPKDHHNYNWNFTGNRIGRKWNIEVTRCSDEDEVGLTMPKSKSETKYIIECPCCHDKWKYQRMSKAVTHPELYQCPKCHKKLIRIL